MSEDNHPEQAAIAEAPEQKQGTPDSDMMTASPYQTPEQTPETLYFTDERKDAIRDSLESALVGVVNNDDPSAECINGAQHHAQRIMWLMAHYDRRTWGRYWPSVEYRIRANVMIHLHELTCFCLFKKSSRELRDANSGSNGH